MHGARSLSTVALKSRNYTHVWRINIFFESSSLLSLLSTLELHTFLTQFIHVIFQTLFSLLNGFTLSHSTSNFLPLPLKTHVTSHAVEMIYGFSVISRLHSRVTDQWRTFKRHNTDDTAQEGVGKSRRGKKTVQAWLTLKLTQVLRKRQPVGVTHNQKSDQLSKKKKLNERKVCQSHELPLSSLINFLSTSMEHMEFSHWSQKVYLSTCVH